LESAFLPGEMISMSIRMPALGCYRRIYSGAMCTDDGQLKYVIIFGSVLLFVGWLVFSRLYAIVEFGGSYPVKSAFFILIHYDFDILYFCVSSPLIENVNDSRMTSMKF
jgi:hypothetical protein